jgi:DNA-binding CsgD family transcriptional regulator
MENSSQANVRLGSAKGDLLLAIVYSLYRTLREAERWPTILQQVQELLGGQACSLSIHDFRTRTGAIAIHSGCFEGKFLRLYEERYAAQDPWLKREEHHRSAGATWIGDELVPQAQLLMTEFYQRWLRPQGLLHQCSGVLIRDRHRLVQLTTYRSGRDKAFDRATLYPLQRLLPHIRQTLELQHRLASIHPGTNHELGDLLRRLGSTTPVIAAERRLLESAVDDTPVNDAPSSQEQFDTTSERFAAKLRALLAVSLRQADDRPSSKREDLHEGAPSATPGATPAASVRPAAATQRPAVVATLNTRPLPINKGNSPRRWLPLVLADDATQPKSTRPEAPESNEDCLRRLYGLTRCEARIAELLAKGLTMSAAAQRLNVGLNTVRTHLQRIYSKTDTHHQSGLVALLLTGPARLQIVYEADQEDDADERDAPRTRRGIERTSGRAS